MGAEPTGEEHDGIGLLDEEQLAREEVPEIDQLLVSVDDGVRELLVRQPNVDPEAAIATGPALACLHDARTCAGNDHEPAIGDAPRELLGESEDAVARTRAGRAERADFPYALVRGEELERVPHLFQRARYEFQVADGRAVAQQLLRSENQLVDVALRQCGRVGGGTPRRLGALRRNFHWHA